MKPGKNTQIDGRTKSGKPEGNGGNTRRIGEDEEGLGGKEYIRQLRVVQAQKLNDTLQ